MYRVLAGLALAGLMAGSAVAESIKVGDLGAMPSRRICMSIAKEVLDTYLRDYGGYSTAGNTEDPDAWAYYGWDLRPGNNDVVIICPYVGEQANAFFTIHSSGPNDSADGDVVYDRLRELWDRLY